MPPENDVDTDRVTSTETSKAVNEALVRFGLTKPPAPYQDSYKAFLAAWQDLAIAAQPLPTTRAQDPGSDDDALVRVLTGRYTNLISDGQTIQGTALTMGLSQCSSSATTLLATLNDALLTDPQTGKISSIWGLG